MNKNAKTAIVILDGIKSRSTAIVKRCTGISAELNQTTIDIAQNKVDACSLAISTIKKNETAIWYCTERIKQLKEHQEAAEHIFDDMTASLDKICRIEVEGFLKLLKDAAHE